MPSSVSATSRLTGSAAFDDDVENATSDARAIFRKYVTGFIPTVVAITRPSTPTPNTTAATITVRQNMSRLPSSSTPNAANAAALSANTPYGASLSTQPMMTMQTSVTPSKNAISGALRSVASVPAAAPNRIVKNTTASRSRSASARNGLRGMISTSVCTSDVWLLAAFWACVANGAASASRTPASRPEPGRSTANASNPTTVATAVASTANPSVRAPTLPTWRTSPNDAVPVSSVLTTSGRTIIVMSRMNAVPTGSTT